MRLLTAILARNEASPDRYLSRVLDRCREFSDQILLLDDGSTDDTVEVALKAGAIVRKRELSVPAWGNEASARAELWEFAVGHCEDARSWVLFADADMVLHGDPRPLCQSFEVTSWAFPLFDVWDEDETVYREDQFWRGHLFPRVWLVAPKRMPQGWVAQWNPRGIHCGHLPANWMGTVGLAPPDVYWLHLGWSRPHHRDEKFQAYLAKAHLLTDAERAHAESILSPDP